MNGREETGSLGVVTMTMDRTLKTSGGLARTRNVLTRAERITMLTEEGKFDPEADAPFGLPKLKLRHSKAGTKTKKVEAPAEGEAAAEAGAESTVETKKE